MRTIYPDEPNLAKRIEQLHQLLEQPPDYPGWNEYEWDDLIDHLARIIWPNAATDTSHFLDSRIWLEHQIALRLESFDPGGY